LFPLCRAKQPRRFVLIAFELVSHPEQRTENGGAIIAGQVDAGFAGLENQVID
jgi:hypothetical protein